MLGLDPGTTGRAERRHRIMGRSRCGSARSWTGAERHVVAAILPLDPACAVLIFTSRLAEAVAEGRQQSVESNYVEADGRDP